MEFYLYCIALGLSVGAVSALIGLGGGIFMVPLMPVLFGFSIIESVATSLFTVSLVSSLNTITYARKGLVRWEVGLMMGVPAALVALGMGSLAVKAGEGMVQWALLIVMIVLAVSTYLKRNLLRDVPVEPITTKKRVYMICGGATSGVISGFTGVGTGLIISPLMIFNRLVQAKELAPTANSSMMVTTTFAVLGYILAQSKGATYVHFDVGLTLFAAAFVSSALLRPYQQKMPGPLKATIIATILLVMITKVGWSLFT